MLFPHRNLTFWKSFDGTAFSKHQKEGFPIKAKRSFPALLAGAAALCLLTGCSGQSTAARPDGAASPEEGVPVKTGLSVTASAASSSSATQASDGLAQSGITMVAVTVDEEGTILRCVIDELRCDIHFNAQGKLVTDPATRFPSKNELGRSYGMHQASSIDKDWNEQAAAFAAYVEGKRVDDVVNMALTPEGRVSDVDLAASATLSVEPFIAGIKTAAENARHLGAQQGDALKLTCTAAMASSMDADRYSDGLAQVEATIAAVTMEDKVISSCLLDAVQTKVSFDHTGAITSDLAAPILTKNQLGRDYGMHQASTIDKDWSEQAASFAAYVTGKTPKQAAGIKVDEAKRPVRADLTASVTFSIGDFQALLVKAGQ